MASTLEGDKKVPSGVSMCTKYITFCYTNCSSEKWALEEGVLCPTHTDLWWAQLQGGRRHPVKVHFRTKTKSGWTRREKMSFHKSFAEDHMECSGNWHKMEYKMQNVKVSIGQNPVIGSQAILYKRTQILPKYLFLDHENCAVAPCSVNKGNWLSVRGIIAAKLLPGK